MKAYRVKIEAQIQKLLDVRADSDESALEQAEQQFKETVLDADLDLLAIDVADAYEAE